MYFTTIEIETPKNESPVKFSSFSIKFKTFLILQLQVFFLCPMKVPKLVRLWWKMILPPLPRHKFQPKMQ